MTSVEASSDTAVERNKRPYRSVLDTIGWTPLIRLTHVTRGIQTPVYGKAEFFNPGGSLKDRIGLPIIEQAEREGRLKPGGTIVEGTSGNTGVGLAIAAALRGYRCIFTMPDKMSQEKVRLLKAFGAEVIVTPTAVPPDHPDNYIMTAKRIASETPNAILANQFYNDANPAAHYDTTGPELWEQTEGRITHFVYAAGTGGTITGVGRYLKDKETAEAVAGQFREIGLQAEAAPLDWTIYTDKMRSPGGMDDLYLLGLGSRFNGPEDLSIVTTGQIWDQTKWITHTQNGPKFNAMYKELIETIDEKKQREMAFQMEQLFVEETPWINLWIQPGAAGVNRRLDWEDSGGGDRLNLWLPAERDVRFAPI